VIRSAARSALRLVILAPVAFNVAMLALSVQGPALLWFGVWFAGDAALSLIGMALADRIPSQAG